MVRTRRADRQVGHHSHSHCPQHLLGAHPGQHQKLCGSNCSCRQHDSIRGQIEGTVGSDALQADGSAAAKPDPSHPRVGQQGEVGAVHRGLQVRAAGAHPGPAVVVERHRADAGRQRLLVRGAVEIVDPPVAASPTERTKAAVQPSNSETRRTTMGPSDPCKGVSKSRSLSIARKCGNTSSHIQPRSPQPSKSPGRPRQKYPPFTAPEPPTTTPRMICACRLGSSVNVVG